MVQCSPSATPRALWHKARGCASAALPRVQVASCSLPRKGLCRSCPPGGWNKHRPNGIRFAGAEEECTRKACPLYTQCPNTKCHPFGPSAQPFQGCFYIPNPPMVAPRRCNHGLCGRIPLGFPEGLRTVYCLLFALPLLKNGRTSCAPSTINEEPTTTPSSLREPRSGFCPAAQGCAVPRATLGARGRVPTTTTWLCRGDERAPCPAQALFRN